MERLNLQARVARELPQLEQEFNKVNRLYSLAISFDVHVEPEEMALYQTLMPSFHSLKVGMSSVTQSSEQAPFHSRELSLGLLEASHSHM